MGRFWLRVLCVAAVACVSLSVGATPGRAASRASRAFAHEGSRLEQPPTSVGTRPLLVFVLRFADSAPNGGWVGPWDQSFAANRFFGADDVSVNGYMRAASMGAFSFRPAIEGQGVTDDGIVEAYYGGSSGDFARSQAAAVAAMHATDDVVDYTRFDADGDRVLEPEELAIELVELGGDPSGNGETGPLCCSPADGDGIDGLTFARDLNVAAVNAYSNVMTSVHELFHQAFGTLDGYSWGVGQLDIMGPTVGVPDDARWLPNAVTRFQLGWIHPSVVEADDAVRTREALSAGDAVIVHDPSFSDAQFFLVEYRTQRGLDRNASANGVVVWRVVNDSSRTARSDDVRPVELVTPAVIASDTRVAGCASGCRRGAPADAFEAASNQPVVLRYTAPSPRYSAGAYSGMLVTPSGVMGDAVELRVQFGAAEPAPAAAVGAGSSPRLRHETGATTATAVATTTSTPTPEPVIVATPEVPDWFRADLAQIQLVMSALDFLDGEVSYRAVTTLKASVQAAARGPSAPS